MTKRIFGAGRRAVLLGALAAPAVLRPAWGQGFPSRPIRLVVPFPPAGAADITARLVGERVASLLGQSVVVDNKPGAGGNIAAEFVARAAPDGYTLFLGGATIFCAKKFHYGGSIPFDPIRDFTHLSRVSIGWYSIDGPAGLPAEIAKRLHGAVVQAVKQPDYGEKLRPLGFTPISDPSPAEFTAYIEAQIPLWQELVRVSGARIE